MMNRARNDNAFSGYLLDGYLMDINQKVDLFTVYIEDVVRWDLKMTAIHDLR